MGKAVLFGCTSAVTIGLVVWTSMLEAGVSGLSLPEIVVPEADGRLADGGLADYSVPVGVVRWVYPLDAANVPAPVAHFWETVGESWRTYWNEDLETPAFTFPPSPIPLAEAGIFGDGVVDEARLVDAVGRFLERHAVFFGVGRAGVAIPEVYPLDQSWVVVVRQLHTASGLTIRGAGLRAVVHRDGTLRWIKAHLVRDLPALTSLRKGDVLLDREAIDQRVALWDGEVERAHLEIAFPDGTLRSARPLWNLDVRDADGWRTETTVDALHGGVVLRKRAFLTPDARAVQATDDVVEDGGGGGVGAAPLPELPEQTFLVFGGAEGSRLDDGLEEVSFVESKLFGAVVREVFDDVGPRREQVVSISDQNGLFRARTRAGMPKLSLSLEGRRCPNTDTAACFVAATPEVAPDLPLRFRIRPILTPAQTGNVPFPLLSYDANNDSVPDAEMVYDPAQNAFIDFDVQAAPTTPILDSLEFRSLWVESYLATEISLNFEEKTVGLAKLDALLPLPCLDLHPLPSGPEFLDQFDDDPNFRCLSVLVPQQVPSDPAPGETTELEPVTTSIIYRQAARHAFRALTGTVTTNGAHERLVADGILDGLAAVTRNNPSIGFRADQQPTSRAFVVDRPVLGQLLRVRQEFGRGVFRLHSFTTPSRVADELVSQAGELSEGAAIVYRWLAGQRLDPALPVVRQFVCSPAYVDELVLAAEAALDDGDPATPTPYAELIRTAFDDAPFLDNLFRRGDADGNGHVDLVDVLHIANFLFAYGDTNECWNAFDANNDASLDLVDVLSLVNHLFFNVAQEHLRIGVCALDMEPPCDPGNLGCRAVTCDGG